MHELFGSLKANQQDLLRETEPDRMTLLDEDELLKLHSRVRRARNKHVKNYRREAASRVTQEGGRGEARPKNSRAAAKAEVFEDALARVSHQVDILAQRAAEELRAERLAAARAGRSTGPDSVTASSDGPTRAGGAADPRAATKTTGGRKRDASSQAQGARRQARRDSR